MFFVFVNCKILLHMSYTYFGHFGFGIFQPDNCDNQTCLIVNYKILLDTFYNSFLHSGLGICLSDNSCMRSANIVVLQQCHIYHPSNYHMLGALFGSYISRRDTNGTIFGQTVTDTVPMDMIYTISGHFGFGIFRQGMRSSHYFESPPMGCISLLYMTYMMYSLNCISLLDSMIDTSTSYLTKSF